MSYDGPIDPSSYRSWVYVKHTPEDNGARYPGWASHNELFSISRDDDEVGFHIVLANRGWSNAWMVNVDIFVPTHNDWAIRHEEGLSLHSGEELRMDYNFTVGPGYAEDGQPVSFQPSFALRVTDLLTPAPTQMEILDGLRRFKTDFAGAVDQMRSWKKMPGFFVYPCCALFA